MRTVIIGDIHGCYTELLALLNKAGLSESDNRLIFVGDMVDRGDDPYAVIEHVRLLQKSMGERCIVIRGNHEQMMLNAMTNPLQKSLWKMNGSGKTIKSFHRHKRTVPMVREWMLSSRMYFETDDFITAHAGINPMGPEKTDDDTFLWDRTIAANGSYSGKLFIYGHTPMREAIYQDGYGHLVELADDTVCVLPPTGSICIDTGCVYGNKLTAMVIENNTFILKSVKSGKQFNFLSK